MSEQRETPAVVVPTTEIATAEPNPPTNGAVTPVAIPTTVEQVAVIEAEAEEPPPVVRMRNTPAAMADLNGQQVSINGHAAVARGLELLAETEMSQNNEEMKKLDTQLDHFNKYLDKFEKKNSELTDRLTNLLQNKKEERVKRRASFMQKEEELKQEQDSFESQMRTMFAKCAQMRRTSAPVLETGVESMLETSRRIRGAGANETPIHEANGHDETETATTN